MCAEHSLSIPLALGGCQRGGRGVPALGGKRDGVRNVATSGRAGLYKSENYLVLLVEDVRTQRLNLIVFVFLNANGSPP